MRLSRSLRRVLTEVHLAGNIQKKAAASHQPHFPDLPGEPLCGYRSTVRCYGSLAQYWDLEHGFPCVLSLGQSCRSFLWLA